MTSVHGRSVGAKQSSLLPSSEGLVASRLRNADVRRDTCR
jgi:hypothetical protein